MHAPNGLVDGMLLCAFLTCQTVKRHLQIVHQRLVVQVLVILAVKFFERLQLLDISEAYIRSQIEVESRYRLSSVHLVLAALHRDTCQNRSRLDALGRARGAMPCHESALQNMIQRMLHAGERLRWIIVLIVDMQIVVLHSVATVLRQQIVVDEGLRRLRGELHHHTCRCVGVHVSIFARHVVVLNVHDIEEHLARFGLTCHTALVAIGDVLLCHVLATRVHQLQLHSILNLLHSHLAVTTLCDMVCYLIEQSLILALIGVEHGFADGSHDFLLIESYDAPVALNYSLYHILQKFLVDVFFNSVFSIASC